MEVKANKKDYAPRIIFIIFIGVIFYVLAPLIQNDITSANGHIENIQSLFGTVAIFFSNYLVMGLEFLVISYAVFKIYKSKDSEDVLWTILIWTIACFAFGLWVNIEILPQVEASISVP